MQKMRTGEEATEKACVRRETAAEVFVWRNANANGKKAKKKMQQKELFSMEEGGYRSHSKYQSESSEQMGSAMLSGGVSNECESQCSATNARVERECTLPTLKVFNTSNGVEGNMESSCNIAGKQTESDAKRPCESGVVEQGGISSKPNPKKRSNAQGKITKQGLLDVLESQGGLCSACKSRLQPEESEVDHKVPRSMGGSDEIGNLQWLCKRCNRAKGTLPMPEFVYMCKLVAENN